MSNMHPNNVAGKLKSSISHAIKLPLTYKRYLELLLFWRGMTEDERLHLLKYSVEDMQFALQATRMMLRSHDAFERFARHCFVASKIEPFHTYINQLFCSFLSTPIEKDDEFIGKLQEQIPENQDDSGCPFLSLNVTTNSPPTLTVVPCEVKVELDADALLNKGGVLPEVPEWLYELSKRQDTMYKGVRPWVHGLERDIATLKDSFFCSTLLVLFSYFVKVDRLYMLKHNSEELSTLVCPSNVADIPSNLWTRHYQWKVDAIKDKPKNVDPWQRLLDLPRGTAEEIELLYAEATKPFEPSKTLVAEDPYTLVETWPPLSWSEEKKGHEWKGTPFAPYKDLLMGRKKPPTTDEVDAQSRESLRLMRQQQQQHAHAHSHGNGVACNHNHQAPPQQKQHSHSHSHGPGRTCNHNHGNAHRNNHQHQSHESRPVVAEPKPDICGRVGCKKRQEDHGEAFKRCSKCGTPYCSRDCQVLDWKKNKHRLTCAMLQQQRK